MNTQDYKNHIQALGLSIRGAGPVLGVSHRQAQRIAAGECPVPEPVAKLLMTKVEGNKVAKDLLEYIKTVNRTSKRKVATIEEAKTALGLIELLTDNVIEEHEAQEPAE